MPEPQIGHLLRRAYFRAQRDATEMLAPLNLTPVQAAALGVLVGGPMSQAALGRRLDMEPANVHALVRRMTAAGLAETAADPENARRVLVGLTAAGRDAAEALQGPRRAAAETTMRPLTPDERATLLRLLARLVE